MVDPKSPELPGSIGVRKSMGRLQNQKLSLRTIEIRDAELLFVQSEPDLLPTKNIPIILSARLELINSTPNEININGFCYFFSNFLYL